jgi:hypothetical protein
MNRFFRWSVALALAAACLNSAAAGEGDALAAPVKLRFDPRFILEAVAQRMNIRLRQEVALPAIFLESAIPLRQFQDAMEGQWSFRPPLVSNSYSIASNEIYLSDDASFYRRLKRTLDDSLAHEFVHYIQAMYLREDLTTDGCEIQAAGIQHWFREEYARRDVAALDAEAGSDRLAGTAQACVLAQEKDGTRTVRCVTRSRPVRG